MEDFTFEEWYDIALEKYRRLCNNPYASMDKDEARMAYDSEQYSEDYARELFKEFNP